MAKITNAVDECALRIFEYEHVDDELEASDGIIAFGNHDTHVADQAARLFLDGWADYIIFAGGFGRITRGLWNQPEAERFAEIALSMGVPENAIYTEPRSANTGENIAFSKALIREKGLRAAKMIVVDRPYRGRRTKAALSAQWPEPRLIMSSPTMSYQDYCEWYEADGPISKYDFISLLVGDLQRIDVYGDKGFQEKQDIPDEVREAYEHLVEQGFTAQMIAE